MHEKIIHVDEYGEIDLSDYAVAETSYKVTVSPEGVICLEPTVTVTITKEEYEDLKRNQK